jgi:hypothetical protein
LTPGSGIRNEKITGSRINIPDHISESLEKFFCVKNTSIIYLMRIRDLLDPGAGIEKFPSGIRNKHPG